MPISTFTDVSAFTSISSATYLALKPLSEQLKTEAVQLEKQGRKNQIIVDVGCGSKPYCMRFSSLASKYWGIDFSNDSLADVFGSAENLPFKDSSADIVLCIQVLEHCEYPDKVLSEISRILQPGGIALVSTHGIFIYHPMPEDYWRWTHKGLQVAFKSAALEVTKVLPNGGPIACLFYLVITLIAMFTYKSRWLAPIRWFFIPFFNFLAEKLDNFFIKYLFPRSKYLLVANYLIVSNKLI